MALTHSKYVRGAERIPGPDKAGEVIAVRYEFAYDHSTHSDGDIVELGILPAHMTVREIVVDADDVDGGTDFEWDLGLMSGKPGEALDEEGNARTCGAEFFSGATLGQSAGVTRPTLKTAYRVTPVAYDRSIGLKLVDLGTVDGVIGFTVWFGAA